MENLDKISLDELSDDIEKRIKEYQKFWTEEDKELQLEVMKNIFDLPIEKAVHQARKWALIEARASVVKIESEEERKAWFDKAIETEDYILKQ